MFWIIALTVLAAITARPTWFAQPRGDGVTDEDGAGGAGGAGGSATDGKGSDAAGAGDAGTAADDPYGDAVDVPQPEPHEAVIAELRSRQATLETEIRELAARKSTAPSQAVREAVDDLEDETARELRGLKEQMKEVLGRMDAQAQDNLRFSAQRETVEVVGQATKLLDRFNAEHKLTKGYPKLATVVRDRVLRNVRAAVAANPFHHNIHGRDVHQMWAEEVNTARELFKDLPSARAEETALQQKGAGAPEAGGGAAPAAGERPPLKPFTDAWRAETSKLMASRISQAVEKRQNA